MKNKYGQRKRIYDLIDKHLASKRKWNVQLAFRFLREVYETDPQYSTARKFSDYLQRTSSGAYDAIVARSNTYIN
jgi:hypothetical protein